MTACTETRTVRNGEYVDLAGAAVWGVVAAAVETLGHDKA